jgi:alkylation response protein AidB-like acyl-CoA dehydrogenase
MDFQLNDEHLMIQQAARDFARNECLPGVIERDEKMQFPRNSLKSLADLGFLGMMVNPDYGGGGLDTLSLCDSHGGDQ